ncbi:response regulator transcription factor [Microbacteriaceae bacterium 4G12]
MKILLVEDDTRLAFLLLQLLKEKYVVDWAKDGEEALLYARASSYDVILLDWMLPHMSGVEVCRQLRKEGNRSGILMLTAKGMTGDRVTGLDAGADDYVVKPFEFSELEARLRALIRRSSLELQDEVLSFGSLSLNCTTHEVHEQGKRTVLTPREYQLLETLVRSRGNIVPRDVLIERVWGLDKEATDMNLDSLVRLVRKKIEKKGQRKIHSVRGVGYYIANV